MSFPSESQPLQTVPLMQAASKIESAMTEPIPTSETELTPLIKEIAKRKKKDLQQNYQIIAVVSTLLAAIASSLLTPLGNENNYKRYSAMAEQDPHLVPLPDLINRLLAACYTALILGIEATCLTCYLKYRLSNLTDEEICYIWKHPEVKNRKRPYFAYFEVRGLALIFWICFVSSILLMVGTILVYMYWQLPPVWFYVWSSFSGVLLVLFLPLLILRLYRTIKGTDFTY